MATNKKIRINYEGKEYTLEFTKNTVRAMQANGFDISKIDTSPNVVIPDLFAGAFRKNHPFVKADVLADIYANLKGKALDFSIPYLGYFSSWFITLQGRIITAIVILLSIFTPYLHRIYIVAGLFDILNEPVTRITDTVSEFGIRFDMIADIY